MERARWSAIGLITVTYIYFLVFAQFGFLHRVRESLGAGHWNLVLGVLGVAGLSGALLAAAFYRSGFGRRWLSVGFAGAGLAAILAAEGTGLPIFVLSAGLSGFFLSILTVALVGVLAEILPSYRVGLVCGLGTGAAYFVSNVPQIFEASARGQCLIAALVCVGGFYCAMGVPIYHSEGPASSGKTRLSQRSPWVSLLGWVGIFLVLIWSDSAAFTRIQETPALKAASWTGAGHLWSLGLVHFFAAVLAGFFMHTGRWKRLLAAAFCGLWIGWAGLEHGFGGLLAAWVYASAVSFYSTALVGFALICGRGARAVVWAGIVYGLSGWLGSAMGIGMVNDLGTIPPGFWLLALLGLAAALKLRERKVAV